jgi:hypothetical protein
MSSQPSAVLNQPSVVVQDPAKLSDDQDTAKPSIANSSNDVSGLGGRRRRRGSKKYNPWLAHVKETMRKNRGVSFKNVLKLAKMSFKSSKYGSKSKSQSHSHSQSQSAGRRRGKRGGNKSSKSSQNGGSGMAGKAPFGENAAPVA